MLEQSFRNFILYTLMVAIFNGPFDLVKFDLYIKLILSGVVENSFITLR